MSDVTFGFVLVTAMCLATVLILALVAAARPESSDAMVKVIDAMGRAFKTLHPWGRARGRHRASARSTSASRERDPRVPDLDDAVMNELSRTDPGVPNSPAHGLPRLGASTQNNPRGS